MKFRFPKETSDSASVRGTEPSPVNEVEIVVVHFVNVMCSKEKSDSAGQITSV